MSIVETMRANIASMPAADLLVLRNAMINLIMDYRERGMTHMADHTLGIYNDLIEPK